MNIEPPAGAAIDESVLVERLRQSLRPPTLTDSLIARGRWLSATCRLQIGVCPLIIRIDQGVPAAAEPVPLLLAWDFSIRGTARAWSALWEPVPPAGWHDLFALTKRGQMRIEGNTYPLLANLQYVKDLIALPRSEARP